jgi:hypothetical protein
MGIEVQTRIRNGARRLFVPVSDFRFAAFPVGTNRILPCCGGPVAPQVTPNRQTGTTLAQQHALMQTRGI